MLALVFFLCSIFGSFVINERLVAVVFFLANDGVDFDLEAEGSPLLLNLRSFM